MVSRCRVGIVCGHGTWDTVSGMGGLGGRKGAVGVSKPHETGNRLIAWRRYRYGQGQRYRLVDIACGALPPLDERDPDFWDGYAGRPFREAP